MTRFTTIALFLIAALPASTQPVAGTSLKLQVETLVQSPTDVRFRVGLENAGSPCKTLYVDPVMSAFALNDRPRTQLLLQLRQKKGPVKPSNKTFAPVSLGARPQDLMPLECGMFFGRYVHLSQFGFERLPPGRYEGKITLVSQVASFVASKAGYMEGLMSVSGESRSVVSRRLVDTEVSTSFQFNVPNT